MIKDNCIVLHVPCFTSCVLWFYSHILTLSLSHILRVLAYIWWGGEGIYISLTLSHCTFCSLLTSFCVCVCLCMCIPLVNNNYYRVVNECLIRCSVFVLVDQLQYRTVVLFLLSVYLRLNLLCFLDTDIHIVAT